MREFFVHIHPFIDGNGRTARLVSTLILYKTGYDPLFFIPRYNKTFGEMDPSIKAKISHRARALKKLKIVLGRYLRGEGIFPSLNGRE
ncbi:MAG: hypothetical protein A3D87_02275 [Omnitrophica WOR_2 bacterium RIFCSPHIGHO2_02_FULL_50_17]|nr:MAG: hypothetical protein A3D87_02275 [Omnitrophica WOR_2 bacterium RIFCSPHIGHO2_02_FULL_50_17]